MNKSLGLLTLVLALGMTAAMDAEARRLGGARSLGMQRQQTMTAPAKPPAATPNTAPGTAAASTAPGAAGASAAAGAAAKRSWMGPIAGLAGVLGIAALASYLGFGPALANLLMIALLAMAALAVFRLVLRKRAEGRGPAVAGGPGAFDRIQRQGNAPESRIGSSQIGSRIGAGLGANLAGTDAVVGQIPADFDVAGFVRNAKSHFMALQAANDARDLDQLRTFLTPEMFDAARADILARGAAPQQTQVFGLEAQLLDVSQQGQDYVASVRFTGSVREQHGEEPEDLNELWHLTKPRNGQGGWVVAGIQQG